jgi:Zn-dependent protease/predicted transcriptional regulator
LLGSFSIGRVLGIPIRINPSWFLSFLVIVSLLSVEVFPGNFPGEQPAVYWILGLGGGIIFFASIVLHELGHCVVARHYSIPVSNITLFIFGGVSQIMSEPGSPRAEFLMAIAGPAVSFLLGGLLLGAGQLLASSQSGLSGAFASLGVINVTLGIFNLLPGFPLDGGRVLRSLIWGLSGNLRTATKLAAVLGRTLAMGLVAFGILSVIAPQGWPVALEDRPWGLWFVFIGLFLNNAAGQTQRQNRMMDLLRGQRADQLLKSDVPTVDADAIVRSFAYDLPNGPDDVVFFATRDGRMIGLLTRDILRRLPVERWGSTKAEEIMIPAGQIAPAAGDDDGAALLQRMDAQHLPCIPVVSDGTVIGVVTRAALLRLLSRGRRFRVLGR